MPDPLKAAANSDLATIKRLHADGVDMTERGEDGTTAIMVAAGQGHATTVMFLHAAGASFLEKNAYGYSALHYAALRGKFSPLQCFLQETGASITYATDTGDTVWDLHDVHMDADPVAIASLLKVMVMLDDAPLAFVFQLSTKLAEITTRGRY
jgi:hypothetical protein